MLTGRLHTLNRPFSGTTRVSRYQKGKTNMDSTEEEKVSGSGISWAPYASLHLAPDRCELIINKYQTAEDQFGLTDRLTLSVTEQMLITYDHFSATSFSSLQQLCTDDIGIFYMADMNVFLLVN